MFAVLTRIIAQAVKPVKRKSRVLQAVLCSTRLFMLSQRRQYSQMTLAGTAKAIY